MLPKLASMSRWQAGGAHLLLSAAVGAAVLAAMILVWYPPPFFEAAGGNNLVLLMVGIDVALGPLLTLAVFNPAKGAAKLRADLAVIGFVQVAALAYGMHVMYVARPAWLVFAVDRFDLVMSNQLADGELAKAAPPWNVRPWGKPPTVGAKVPEDPKLREESLYLALAGIDLTQQPRFFVPYEAVAAEAGRRAKPLAELRALNPQEQRAIDDIVARSGRAEADLGFLPAKGPQRDFVVVVERAGGAIVRRAMLRPWP